MVLLYHLPSTIVWGFIYWIAGRAGDLSTGNRRHADFAARDTIIDMYPTLWNYIELPGTDGDVLFDVEIESLVLVPSQHNTI